MNNIQCGLQVFPSFLSPSISSFRSHYYYLLSIISLVEYGTSSSRSRSHSGPLDRNDGGHNETQQGQIVADLMRLIYDANYDASIVFELYDEWYRTSWNMRTLEDSAGRPR